MAEQSDAELRMDQAAKVLVQIDARSITENHGTLTCPRCNGTIHWRAIEGTRRRKAFAAKCVTPGCLRIVT